MKEHPAHKIVKVDDVVYSVRERTLEQLSAVLESRKEGASIETTRPHFHGTASREEYLDLLRNGWREAVEGVEGLEGLATDSMQRLRFERAVGGAFPIVPAHLAGHPESMLMPAMRDVDSERGLTLILDGSYSADVKKGTVIEYARHVMKLVAWLTAEQIQVAVYLVNCVSLKPGINARWIIPILPAGRVLQPERIAVAMHPSTLRRGIFALKEHDAWVHKLPGWEDLRRGGYGLPRPPELQLLKEVIPEAYSIAVLPKPGTYNVEKAIRNVINLRLKHKD